LDPELSQALQSKCEELGITKTEFAKRALKSALGEPLNDLPAKPLNIEERFAKLEERMLYFEQRLGENLA
jgi:hypothetical protein